ncbi:glycolipid 2-alpha-mannosyltransferase-domain-containing protein [Mycena galopus ATCC 62051]|nr:glycolipid 2-alpha-mannosyltransferase-domain-containing protein [Mycena galopus ATCC 62051]
MPNLLASSAAGYWVTNHLSQRVRSEEAHWRALTSFGFLLRFKHLELETPGPAMPRMPRNHRVYVLMASATASLHLLHDTSLPRIWTEPPYKTGVPEKYYDMANTSQRASAVIVILARNRDLSGAVSSLSQFEAKFNHKFGYPYVFLNEVPFTEEFKRETSALTTASVKFGLIPAEHWFQPEWIDEPRASAVRQPMGPILYGGSKFLSSSDSFIMQAQTQTVSLLLQTRAVETVQVLLEATFNAHRPDVQFYCDIDFDPFRFMEARTRNTKPSQSVSRSTSGPSNFSGQLSNVSHASRSDLAFHPHHHPDFMAANPELISPDNAMGMLTDRTRTYYNRCHYALNPLVWSNFEIAAFNLWRSDAYLKFFEFLDARGVCSSFRPMGIESPRAPQPGILLLGALHIIWPNLQRWGDAPIHTLGAALFARKDQIHFFNEIGYFHPSFGHCPAEPVHTRARASFDHHPWSCLDKYDALFSPDGPWGSNASQGLASSIAGIPMDCKFFVHPWIPSAIGWVNYGKSSALYRIFGVVSSPT